ncbi:MAG TPA: V-type ATPase 116kDa subunit family protein, partial [Spirochaetota bacterium]|nr:V-type ATPase 116kDa subunit family protein [Spirochaetota bacterium]
MIFPQSMIRLNAIILRKDTDSVTKALLNEGIIDFTDIHDKTISFSNQLSPFDKDSAETDIIEIRSRIEQLLSQVNIPLPDTSDLNAEKLVPVDPKEVTDRLDELNLQIRQIRDKQKDIQQSINRKTEIMRQTDLFVSIEASPPPESSVRVATGLIRKSRKEGLTQALSLYPAVIHFSQSTQDEISAIIIYMSRDEERIGTALDRYQWQSVEFPPELTGKKEEILHKLASSIEELNHEQIGFEKEAEDIIRKFAPILTESWKNLTITAQCIKIQNSFGKTSDTVIFSGWLPCHLKNAAEKIIKKITNGKYYIQWVKPEDDPLLNSSIVPVKLNHGTFLKPFQWVVENYSMPQYGSIDPTVIVAFSFLTMFGLMFGDAGHGLVLALCGAIAAFIKRKKHDTAFELARLIMYCGLSSVVAGALFGSYFGLGIFKPLWFDYHGIVLGHKGTGLISDIYDILGITIKFGVAIIGCGLFLNLINCIRSKRYFSFLFDKGGLLGSWFYAGGVYAAFFFVNSNYKSFPPDKELLILTG